MTKSHRGLRILGEVLVILLFLLFMIPFAMVVINSAKTSKDIITNALALPSSWGQLITNVGLIFNNRTVHYANAFVDSALITFFSLAVIVFFSSMCAWALVRTSAAWATILFFVFVAAMVIPFQVLMFPLVHWMRVLGDFLHIRLLQSIPGMVFAYLGFGCPLSIFIFHGFIKNVPLRARGVGDHRRLHPGEDLLLDRAAPPPADNHHRPHPQRHLDLERLPPPPSLCSARTAPCRPSRSR